MKTKMMLRRVLMVGIVILLPVLYSCNKTELIDDLDIIDVETPDWTAETHEKRETPDYDMVFPQDKVIRLDITIDAQYWSALEDDLSDNIGSSFIGFGPGGMGGGPGETDFDPIWIPCTVTFEGLDWYQVGIRVKGNSSLMSTYRSGLKKYSFKLDFDEFEDEIPEINNQRFYGFKQLNLNNNFEDKSEMREKIGSDLFREFGLVSARTSFVAVYINHGDGEQYFGLYTLVEEVDDSVLKNQLGHESGNIYKPEGDAATFAAGTFNESEMEKKNHKDEADYSDVQSLYDQLNAGERLTDPENWMVGLEQVLDVDVFLKWLAANIAMQNWDTYGKMDHNYYLYNNPDSNTLMWVPWDNNESLQSGKQGGALSLSLSEVNSSWPLISYIMDQSSYEAIYRDYLNQFITQTFVPGSMQQKYETTAELIREWVYLEESGYSFLSGGSQFESALESLKSHVSNRELAVQNYLNQ